MVRDGRISVDGRTIRDPESRTHADDVLCIDGVASCAAERRYLMLNKPRGLVTTTDDERGRDTVYSKFKDAGLPWLAPVGRLDKASEGLLLFTNDSEWASRITSPESHLEKTYHVQVDCLPDAEILARIQAGIDEGGEHLAAVSVHELRRGEKNAWLEIVLDEGRNRQIRRLLAGSDISVLRLVRVAIGTLELGELGKGEWRELELDEVCALASPSH